MQRIEVKGDVYLLSGQLVLSPIFYGVIVSGSALSDDTTAPLADYVLAGVLVTVTCVAVALALSFFILA